MEWVFLIAMCLVIYGIVQGGIVAVHQWPITLIVLGIALAIWVMTRIRKLPSHLPEDVMSNATTVSGLTKIVVDIARDHEQKMATYYALTSVQQKKASFPQGVENLIHRRTDGLLMHIQGVVQNVSSDCDWPSVTVTITPNDGHNWFPNGIKVIFGNRWKGALASMNKGSRVEFIAHLKEWEIQESSITNGRILVDRGEGKKWVDDVSTYDSSVCTMTGISIVLLHSDTNA